MKKGDMQKYLSIGYKKMQRKMHCDGCGKFASVLEMGGMTESGYESDYIYCFNCLDIKHPELNRK